MDEATGEAEGTGLRVTFDRRVKLEFHGASVTPTPAWPSGLGLFGRAMRRLDRTPACSGALIATGAADVLV
jgi:hypothetical protein